jgi:hypothetical protein
MAYDVWLKAVSATGRRGQPSLTQRFTWRPPAPERGRVPWPARPLPPLLAFHRGVAATTAIDCPTDRAAYPVGVRIGAMPLLPGRQCPPDPASPIVLASAGVGNPSAPADPNAWLFRDERSRPARTNVTILPAVLYRQQVANANFATVTGDVVQCSPLIEQLAWGVVQLTRDTRASVLFDSFIGVKEQPNAGTLQSSPALELILLDTRAVLGGARYRYWLLHFDPDGEPDGVIPAGEVEVP